MLAAAEMLCMQRVSTAAYDLEKGVAAEVRWRPTPYVQPAAFSCVSRRYCAPPCWARSPDCCQRQVGNTQRGEMAAHMRLSARRPRHWLTSTECAVLLPATMPRLTVALPYHPPSCSQSLFTSFSRHPSPLAFPRDIISALLSLSPTPADGRAPAPPTAGHSVG